MDFKTFAIIFGTVFIAELGDKTQLAAMLFASKSSASLMTVFAAASLALIASTGLAVLAGNYLSSQINEQYLAYAAGMVFIVIGIWTIWQATTA